MRAQLYGVIVIVTGLSAFVTGLSLKGSTLQGLVLVVAMLLVGFGVTATVIGRLSIMPFDGSKEGDQAGRKEISPRLRHAGCWNINADRLCRVAIRTNYVCFLLLFCPLFALKFYLRITGDFQARWAIIVFGVPMLVLAVMWIPAFLVSLYFAFRKRRVGMPLHEALAAVSLPFSILLMCIPF